MEQKKSHITFEVRIEENENYTWQGRLMKEEQVITFQSELELLRAINQLLCGDNKITSQRGNTVTTGKIVEGED